MFFIHELYQSNPLMEKIVQSIAHYGGTPFLVGGAVRDHFLQHPVVDVDVEVHGISPEQFENILSHIGPVHKVGVSFGIFTVTGCPVQWSLPRTDAAGRKPTVSFDPSMTIERACQRRDLTMNAMAINLLTRDYIDPFHGRDDCRNKILRTPDPHFFIHDPLRFYRVMQFIGRFNMTPDAQLTALCQSMDISTVSRERIEQEMAKLLLLSSTPSHSIIWLKTINRLDSLFPELYALINVPQNPEWHPEGDVFTHTMQALDASCDFTYPDKHLTLIMRYAALCHDLGKPVSTVLRQGRWTSYGHAVTGAPIARSFLLRITHNHDLIKRVCALVLHHMAPGELVKNNASAAAYKRLAARISPLITCALLADLHDTDKRGRNPAAMVPLPGPLPSTQEFRTKAEQYAVLYGPEKAVLSGHDLRAYFADGPALGKAIKRAYELQIKLGIQDKEILIKKILN